MSASYQLVGAYPTVQVLSPTLVNDVEYCTIQTNPSGVICSIPIDSVFFGGNGSGRLLTNFATAVEEVMGFPEVIAGVGSQRIDANGLLADLVVFTVQYIPKGSTSSAITAAAEIPVTLLDFSNESSAPAQQAAVNTIIGGVLANLKAAAGG